MASLALRRSRSPRPVRVLALAVVLTVALVIAPPGSSSPASAAAAGPAAAGRGEPEGLWPLDPRPEVVRGFDPPAQRWLAGHRGADLSGTLGQPVRAALAGTVSFAGRIAGVGVVVVDHGGRRTTYQPVVAEVGRGDIVSAGAVLGRLAWFGSHCLPRACLHWGLIESTLSGDRYLDPLTLVGGPQPVRLLPLTGVPAAGLRTQWSSAAAPPAPGPSVAWSPMVAIPVVGPLVPPALDGWSSPDSG